MDWDMAVIEDDDDIVFKVKRSAIAEALRSNALVPIAATDANIDHEEDNVFWIDGAVRDFHVDDAYAESDRVLEFAQISPAAADFFSEHPVCSKNGIIDLSDVMNCDELD